MFNIFRPGQKVSIVPCQMDKTEFHGLMRHCGAGLGPGATPDRSAAILAARGPWAGWKPALRLTGRAWARHLRCTRTVSNFGSPITMVPPSRAALLRQLVMHQGTPWREPKNDTND